MYKNIKSFGRNAVLIEWQQIISDEITSEIAIINHVLRDQNLPGVVDIVPSYASIAIFFDPAMISLDAIKQTFENIQINTAGQSSFKSWKIPVRYNDASLNDMAEVIAYTGLPADEIIRMHSEVLYKVCFIGFLPGFLYLSGLKSELCVPRKKNPSLRVAKGSVAIGGCQTGVYPCESPGGWHVIGHTDVDLFNFDLPPHMKIQPGDHIRFEAI